MRYRHLLDWSVERNDLSLRANFWWALLYPKIDLKATLSKFLLNNSVRLHTLVHLSIPFSMTLCLVPWTVEYDTIHSFQQPTLFTFSSIMLLYYKKGCFFFFFSLFFCCCCLLVFALLPHFGNTVDIMFVSWHSVQENWRQMWLMTLLTFPLMLTSSCFFSSCGCKYSFII